MVLHETRRAEGGCEARRENGAVAAYMRPCADIPVSRREPTGVFRGCEEGAGTSACAPAPPRPENRLPAARTPHPLSDRVWAKPPGRADEPAQADGSSPHSDRPVRLPTTAQHLFVPRHHRVQTISDAG